VTVIQLHKGALVNDLGSDIHFSQYGPRSFQNFNDDIHDWEKVACHLADRAVRWARAIE